MVAIKPTRMAKVAGVENMGCENTTTKRREKKILTYGYVMEVKVGELGEGGFFRARFLLSPTKTSRNKTKHWGGRGKGRKGRTKSG